MGKEQQKTPEAVSGKGGFRIGTALKYFLASLAVFIVIILLGGMFFKPNLPEGIEIMEGSLSKNAELRIGPGEVYIYNYNINNTNNTLTFFTGAAPACVWIQVKEAVNATGTCIDRHGNDRKGSNVSLEVPYISMFKPWMLAVGSRWEWNTTAIVRIVNENVELGRARFRMTREERIFGRESYVVEITSGNEVTIDWIDKERRVLLKEVGRGYVIEISVAPFPIEK